MFEIFEKKFLDLSIFFLLTCDLDTFLSKTFYALNSTCLISKRIGLFFYFSTENVYILVENSVF